MKEKDLYGPMVKWLDVYVKEKFPDYDVHTLDSSQVTLESALRTLGISLSHINGLDIQIDVLSVAVKKDDIRLFFIEAKPGTLTLNNLAQIKMYCSLANPEEAFLMTPGRLGAVEKVVNVYYRRDLLKFDSGDEDKNIVVMRWDIEAGHPNWSTAL